MGGSMTPFFNIALMIGMLLVFYFLLFRPQLQKQKQQQAFFEEIKKGDRVVTTGGIHGRVTQVNGDNIMLDVANGVQLKVATTAISMDLSENLQTNKMKAKSKAKTDKEEVKNS